MGEYPGQADGWPPPQGRDDFPIPFAGILADGQVIRVSNPFDFTYDPPAEVVEPIEIEDKPC